MKLNLIYRPANNPWVNHLINSNRVACGVKLIPKGVGGVRRVYQALKSKESVAMLTDQKTNDGDVVDFFGFPTKCTTLPAKLALKLNARIIAVKAIRTHGANYVVEFDSPLKFDKSDDPIIITNKINLVFEKWIRKNPEQWFWLHKLWG